MLTFRMAENRDAVEIVCDARGVAVLLAAIAKVMSEGSSHKHLFGPAAGGGRDLDAADPWGQKSVSEVVIVYDEHGDR
ncbi:MAG: hypothetical protein HY060_04445 [Proteobacteria bacterium]|nr:hypothetical protein [Pseudomonadota bacterium]